MNYEEAKQVEEKYLSKFTKVQLFFMLMGEYKGLPKEKVEKHFDDRLSDLKNLNEPSNQNL